MSLLVLEALSVLRDRRPVVDRLDLEVGEGEVVALLGRNGAGRTTLLEGLAGLLPCTGAVRLRGVAVGGRPGAARAAGLALAAGGRGLLPTMTVEENLRLAVRTLPAHEREATLAGLRARLPLLAERGSQAAGSLSGGERQLAALACALAARPLVVLLDDPTAGLSPMGRDAFADALLAFLAAARTACLVADDHAGFLLRVATRVVVLQDGRKGLERRLDPSWSVRDLADMMIACDARKEA